MTITATPRVVATRLALGDHHRKTAVQALLGGLSVVALTALSLLVASDRYPLWTLWLAPVAVLIPLTFVWGPRTLPEGRSMGAVLVAEAVLVTGTITVLRGWNGGEAAALGVANVGVAVLLGTALRRAWGNRWYPSTPVELGLGQLATLGAAAWLIVLDGVPGIDPARLSTTDGLWWLANLFVQCSLGLLLVMLPHFPGTVRRFPRPPYLLQQILALTVVTLVAMVVASAHREYPLAWLLLARWTPPPLRAWRRFLLRLFGARIAPTANIYASARIWSPANLTIGDHAAIGPCATIYCMAPITIARFAVVSQGAHLCAGTHDIEDPAFQLRARPIAIGARAWIAAEAFVGPGVTVGEGAVLGARGCAMRDLEQWTVYRGNPAEAVRRRRVRFEDAR